MTSLEGGRRAGDGQQHQQQPRKRPRQRRGTSELGGHEEAAKGRHRQIILAQSDLETEGAGRNDLSRHFGARAAAAMRRLTSEEVQEAQRGTTTCGAWPPSEENAECDGGILSPCEKSRLRAAPRRMRSPASSNTSLLLLALLGLASVASSVLADGDAEVPVVPGREEGKKTGIRASVTFIDLKGNARIPLEIKSNNKLGNIFFLKLFQMRFCNFRTFRPFCLPPCRLSLLKIEVFFPIFALHRYPIASSGVASSAPRRPRATSLIYTVLGGRDHSTRSPPV